MTQDEIKEVVKTIYNKHHEFLLEKYNCSFFSDKYVKKLAKRYAVKILYKNDKPLNFADEIANDVYNLINIDFEISCLL